MTIYLTLSHRYRSALRATRIMPVAAEYAGVNSAKLMRVTALETGKTIKPTATERRQIEAARLAIVKAEERNAA